MLLSLLISDNYSFYLKQVELETLKTYIKINLTNRFIKLSKFPTNASIFFDK